MSEESPKYKCPYCNATYAGNIWVNLYGIVKCKKCKRHHDIREVVKDEDFIRHLKTQEFFDSCDEFKFRMLMDFVLDMDKRLKEVEFNYLRRTDIPGYERKTFKQEEK